MHPHLWTVPGIGFDIQSYGFTIAVGIVLAVWIAMRRAKRAGADDSAVFTLALVGVIFGIIGCRVMHFMHHKGAALRSGELGVGEMLTAHSGGEIVGGVVLGVLSVIVYLRIRRKPVGLYLDIAFPPMILAMGIGRIGCFFAGCCWGGVCATGGGAAALPWAVHFPYGSPAYVRAWSDEQLDVPDALLWQPPKADLRFPIPPDVLAGVDVDGDAALANYVFAAEAAANAHKHDPDNPETKRLTEKMEEAAKALGRKAAPDEIYAVLHLRDLRERGTPHTWAELRALAAKEHSAWVHPTQLYDAIACVLIFFLLSAIFYRRKRNGMVVAWGMILYGINRPLQEIIRGDNPHDTFGLTISQFMSLAILAAGIVLALVLLRRQPIDGVKQASATGRT